MIPALAYILYHFLSSGSILDVEGVNRFGPV